MKGILYGVGVGPGDPKLLTLLAVETIKKAHCIVVPDMGKEKTALKIAEPYIDGKEIFSVEMPMTRDENELRARHEEAAKRIAKELDEGRDVAFLTLGDPTIYSTYIYVHRIILSMGFEAQIVNGIPSFCAAAARLSISLCDKSEALHIIPASYGKTEELLALSGNKVLMKSGKQMEAVVDMLKTSGQIDNAMMVERCSMEDEKVYRNLSEVKNSGYFSLIIVREEN